MQERFLNGKTGFWKHNAGVSFPKILRKNFQLYFIRLSRTSFIELFYSDVRLVAFYYISQPCKYEAELLLVSVSCVASVLFFQKWKATFHDQLKSPR